MMNMMEKKNPSGMLSMLMKKPVEGPTEQEDDVNEEAANLEVMKELIDGLSANKPEKALRAFKMLFESLYEECEEESDEYDGMKFASTEG
jgi:hypothetical protein